VLNKLKVMKNSTSIHMHWGFNSKKFFKKFYIHMWFIFTHACPCVNYEWIKIKFWKWTKTQLGMNLDLINNELKLTRSELKIN
jgi:hypothetical protein